MGNSASSGALGRSDPGQQIAVPSRARSTSAGWDRGEPWLDARGGTDATMAELRLLFATVLSLLALCRPAGATWSIILIDTRTGEIAIASATCVDRIDLETMTPVVVAGIGAGVGPRRRRLRAGTSEEP